MSEAVSSDFGCRGHLRLGQRFGFLDNNIILKVHDITLWQFVS
jgi:hypothetical protein